MTQNEIDALKRYPRKANRATHSYWIQIILLIFFKRDCLKKRRHFSLIVLYNKNHKIASKEGCRIVTLWQHEESYHWIL